MGRGAGGAESIMYGTELSEAEYQAPSKKFESLHSGLAELVAQGLRSETRDPYTLQPDPEGEMLLAVNRPFAISPAADTSAPQIRIFLAVNSQGQSEIQARAVQLPSEEARIYYSGPSISAAVVLAREASRASEEIKDFRMSSDQVLEFLRIVAQSL